MSRTTDRIGRPWLFVMVRTVTRPLSILGVLCLISGGTLAVVTMDMAWAISLRLFGRVVDGVIETSVAMQFSDGSPGQALTFRFGTADDRPVQGQWECLPDEAERFEAGALVKVYYRPDAPWVNALDSLLFPAPFAWPLLGWVGLWALGGGLIATAAVAARRELTLLTDGTVAEGTIIAVWKIPVTTQDVLFGEKLYRYDVRYAFVVDARTYEGGVTGLSESEAAQFAAQDDCTVYYDPEDPDRNILGDLFPR